MNEYTPEKVAELADELRAAVDRGSYPGGGYQYVEVAPQDAADAADTLAVVSAERDALQARITERDMLLSRAADFARATASTVDQVMSGLLAISNVQADRDRLHKAITEALAAVRRECRHDLLPYSDADRILRAVLDQEGNDDE